MACFSVVALMMRTYIGEKWTKVFGLFAKYTMLIFVMHTLFAAPLRTVLFRMGVQNATVYVVLGIMISFAGPMIAAEIM